MSYYYSRNCCHGSLGSDCIQCAYEKVTSLEKKNAIFIEAVDDILNDNLYQNEIHNILNEALEKIAKLDKEQ